MEILPIGMDDTEKQNELFQQIYKPIFDNHLSLHEVLGVFYNVHNKLVYECSLLSKD